MHLNIVGLVALCGGLATIVVAAGDKDRDWWKKTIVYQIYPRSFQDTNGDGVGDLKGITSRLDHFSYLNVGTIWLSPFYKSPMVDFGYDIADFVNVDPVFGNLDDFDEMVREAHKRGIHVVVDFIPNHSSDQHFWFQESRKGGTNNPYSDYYIWSDGKILPDGTRAPPNNWLSVFSGDSWTWDSLRGQYYLHQFAPEQPDLNYRNPKVQEEMKKVLKFWVDRDVDGFRVDAIGGLFEVEDLSLDEPRSFKPNVSPRDYDYLNHIYTNSQPEIHEVIREWRDMFDEHERKTGKHTFMVMEFYDDTRTYVETMKYYHSGADMPFNFDLIHVNKSCDGTSIKSYINAWLRHMPEGKWPNFVIGNHDRHRITYRKGLQYADALNVLILTLPGTPTTYYGEEIAMNEIEVNFEDVQDVFAKNLGPELYMIYNRDMCRAPMQWTDEPNSGFSSAQKTWLPVHPDYKARNVEAQKKQGPHSHLEIYRASARLRQEKALQTTDIYFLETSSNLVSYVRYNPDDPRPIYLITINVGKQPTVENHEFKLLGTTFKSGKVILNTESKQFVGKDVTLNEITLKPGQAFILRLSESAKEEL